MSETTRLDFVGLRRDLLALAPGFAAKIAPVYALLGWKWVDENDRRDTPNEEQIRARLFKMIGEIGTTPEVDGARPIDSLSTGGLWVGADEYGRARIEFAYDEQGSAEHLYDWWDHKEGG